MKRKVDSSNEQEAAGKRLKLTDNPKTAQDQPEPQASTSNPLVLLEAEVVTNVNEGIKIKDRITKENGDRSSKPHGQDKERRLINKLVPPRPFPTVPTSVSATGPRSSHKEGKNLICITRKTSLACYLRRCKDVIIKDG